MSKQEDWMRRAELVLVKYELRPQRQRICSREAKISVVTGVPLDKIRQTDPEGQKAFVLGPAGTPCNE
jgi:hypothetical protein